MQPQHLVAQLAHLRQRVRDEYGRCAAAYDLAHLGLALLAERTVADGEHLVKDQNIRLDKARDRESEAALHARGELLERPVLKLAQFGKVYDRLVGLVHELARIAQHCAAQIRILAHGQVTVKAAAQLEQRGDRPLAVDAAARRLHDPGDGLEQRRFPGTVAADDAEHLAALQREADVAVCPELGDVVIVPNAAEDIFLDADVLEVPGYVPDGHIFSFEYTHAATSDIVQEPVVVLLIHEAADPDGDKRVRKHEGVEPQRGHGRLDDDLAEIADEEVYRVQQEQILRVRGIAVDGIENRRHVHQQLREDAPEVLDITEEDEQRREDEPHADVEADEQPNGIEQHDPAPGEGDAVQNAEEHEDAERQGKVDEALHVLRQEEEVLRDVDLGEDAGVVHEGAHALRGRFIEEGEDEVAAEQVCSIVIHAAAEELGKHEPHDQQHHERREQAPHRAEDCTLVFLFEVAFHQFFKKELVTLDCKVNFISQHVSTFSDFSIK